MKKQLPSFDINIKPETIKFIIGDDQIKLGEIVKEGTLIINIVSCYTFDYQYYILLMIVILISTTII